MTEVIPVFLADGFRMGADQVIAHFCFYLLIVIERACHIAVGFSVAQGDAVCHGEFSERIKRMKDQRDFACFSLLPPVLSFLDPLKSVFEEKEDDTADGC